MADFPIFDPDDVETFHEIFDGTLKPMAIHWCNRDIEAAKELVQETVCRLYQERRWERQRKLARYEALVPYAVTMMKHIHSKGFQKQQRRDRLRGVVEKKFGQPVDELAKTEDRIYLQKFIRVIASLFSGNTRMLMYIRYEFIENRTPEEFAQ